MAEAVDRRRLGELGYIERDVPRTRHFCPIEVPKGSARRAPEIDRRQIACPGAVASLRNDLDDLLACFRCRTLAGRRQVRTTNAIERRFREVRRRTRPMGTFRDRTSTDRILHAVFIHESRSRGISTPLSLTHDS